MKTWQREVPDDGTGWDVTLVSFTAPGAAARMGAWVEGFRGGAGLPSKVDRRRRFRFAVFKFGPRPWGRPRTKTGGNYVGCDLRFSIGRAAVVECDRPFRHLAIGGIPYRGNSDPREHSGDGPPRQSRGGLALGISFSKRLTRAARLAAQRAIASERARTHPQARPQRRGNIVQRRVAIAAKFSRGVRSPQPVAASGALRINALHGPARQILHALPPF